MYIGSQRAMAIPSVDIRGQGGSSPPLFWWSDQKKAKQTVLATFHTGLLEFSAKVIQKKIAAQKFPKLGAPLAHQVPHTENSVDSYWNGQGYLKNVQGVNFESGLKYAVLVYKLFQAYYWYSKF